MKYRQPKACGLKSAAFPRSRFTFHVLSLLLLALCAPAWAQQWILDGRPETETANRYPVFAPFDMTMMNGTIAVDIELKASLNNFATPDIAYWYDSRGTELNPGWNHPAADHAARLHYIKRTGIADVRAHQIKTSSETSLATALGADRSPHILIYPSLTLYGTGTPVSTAAWLNEANSANITWCYCLVGAGGPEIDAFGKIVWRTTEITGWSTTQK